MSRNKNIAKSEPAFMSRNEVRAYLKCRIEKILIMEELGFIKSVRTGNMFLFHRDSIYKFANDLVNNQDTLAKTSKQKQFLLNNWYQDK